MNRPPSAAGAETFDPQSAIEKNSEIPALVQVKDCFRAEIVSGRLSPGERLPSIRKAGQILGVHPLTIAEAYRRLASDGLVRIRAGVGAFVAEKPDGGELLIAAMRWGGSDTYSADITEAIARQGRLGDLMIATVMADDERSLLSIVKARADRGLLRGVWLRGAPADLADEAVRFLDRYGIPLVALCHCPLARHTAGVDLLAAIRDGARYLIERDRRRVALVAHDTRRHPERIEAFRATCAALDAEYAIESMPYERNAPPGAFEMFGRRAAERLLSADAAPDAVLIADDYIGRGVLTTLLRRNTRVPEDLCVCTLSRVGSGYPGVFGMPVVRLEVDTSQVGDAACRTMSQLVRGEKIDEPHVRVAPRLLEPEADDLLGVGREMERSP